MGCNNSKTLQQAVKSGNAKKVEHLLKTTNCNAAWRDPDALTAGSRGNTAFHVLCTFGKRMADAERMKITRQLVNSGADLDVRNDLGATPLMVACANDLADIATYLIRCGASKNMKNIAGVTASGYCNPGDDNDCAAVLEETQCIPGFRKYILPNGWNEVYPGQGATPYFQSSEGKIQNEPPPSSRVNISSSTLREAKKTC